MQHFYVRPSKIMLQINVVDVNKDVFVVLSIEKQMLFLLSHTESMETAEMTQIYEKRNYSASYIRNALARLKKEGYVTSPSRSLYQITDAGRAFIRSINRKPQRYNEVWDKSWVIVMVEVPEQQRRKRDRFRSEMVLHGFGLLYHSVYISPWDDREDVLQYVRKLELEERVSIFHGQLHPSISPDKARMIWHLDKVEQLYQEKREWFIEEFKPAMQRTIDADQNPLELFLLYLKLGEAISECSLSDPMLPQELLPEGWIAKHVLNDLYAHHSMLARMMPAESPYSRFMKG